MLTHRTAPFTRHELSELMFEPAAQEPAAEVTPAPAQVFQNSLYVKGYSREYPLTIPPCSCGGQTSHTCPGTFQETESLLSTENVNV